MERSRADGDDKDEDRDGDRDRETVLFENSPCQNRASTWRSMNSSGNCSSGQEATKDGFPRFHLENCSVCGDGGVLTAITSREPES